MKSIKKSKLAVLIALSLLTVACAFAAFAIGNKNTAFADGKYSITKEAGAQLRLNTEGGMRFRFTMDEATKTYVTENESVKVQFLFAPTRFFDKGIAETYGVKGFLENESEDIYASEDGSKYYVNGCLNVSLKNVALDFTCEARIAEVDSDGVTVKNIIASAQSDSRNIYSVVNRTLFLTGEYEKSIFDETKTPYSAWFGTESYPVLVNSQQEYDSLVAKCATAGNTSFANVSVAIDGSVNYNAEDFAEAEGKPSVAAMYTVTFMNGDKVYKTVKVKEGQTAIAPALNPTKDFDGVYTYKFSEWEGSLTEITKDETINAVYTKKAIIEDEIAKWEAEGAVNLGSSLNNDEVVDAMGSANVYSAQGGYNVAIANGNIQTGLYSKIYLAFKTSKQVSLANSNGKNVTESDQWYYVCYEKQDGGNWTFTVKPFGANDYRNTLKSVTIVYDDQYFAAGNASFVNMFKTWLWKNDSADREHVVYATDVWGVSVIDAEFASWKDLGADKLGSALNSNEPLEEKFGTQNVYKTAGAWSYDIANGDVAASEYTNLYFAYKTSVSIYLSSSDSENKNVKDTWYFVHLHKKDNGSWTIEAKKNGETTYTPLAASDKWFSAGAKFTSLFMTRLWTGSSGNESPYEVYATDVWGVSVIDAEFASWKDSGAEDLGSALNSSELLEEKFGRQNVYKTHSTGWKVDIANDIDITSYSDLYFAYKTSASVMLGNSDSNHTPNNTNIENTWYFVHLHKQDDGSWTIEAKKYGETGYVELYANPDYFASADTSFVTMFKTWGWNVEHDIYATDVWGVK